MLRKPTDGDGECVRTRVLSYNAGFSLDHLFRQAPARRGDHRHAACEGNRCNSGLARFDIWQYHSIIARQQRSDLLVVQPAIDDLGAESREAHTHIADVASSGNAEVNRDALRTQDLQRI